VATGVVAVWTLFALIGLLQLLIAVHVRLVDRPAPTFQPDDLHRLPKKPGRGAGGAIALAHPELADDVDRAHWADPAERS
jgi:hypothetical protein